jgi:hypothetical protein
MDAETSALSRRSRCELLLVMVLSAASVAACSTAPRRPAPIYSHDDPAPVGFSSAVRIVTLDQQSFEQSSAQVLKRVQNASRGRPINVLRSLRNRSPDASPRTCCDFTGQDCSLVPASFEANRSPI